MIDDLRHLPPDAFQVLREELAGYALAAFLFLAWLADRFGLLAT